MCSLFDRPVCVERSYLGQRASRPALHIGVYPAAAIAHCAAAQFRTIQAYINNHCEEIHESFNNYARKESPALGIVVTAGRFTPDLALRTTLSARRDKTRHWNTHTSASNIPCRRSRWPGFSSSILSSVAIYFLYLLEYSLSVK